MTGEEVTRPVVEMIQFAYNSPKRFKRFVDFFIYSPEAGKGTGKTVFALRILRKLYGDWDSALDYLFVDPITTIEFIVDLVKKRKRIISFACDDIGLWLSGIEFMMSKGKEKKAIASFYSFYNAIRSISASCLFTSPLDDMIKVLFKQVNYRIAIKPIDEDYCEAKIYRVKTNPLFRQFVKTSHIETFPVKIPDNIYQKYEEKRWNALEWKAKELLKYWKDAEEDVIEPNAPDIIREVYIPDTQSVNPINIYKNYRMGSHDSYADSVTFPKALSKKYALHKGYTFVWIDIGFPIGVPDIYFEKFMQTFFKKQNGGDVPSSKD